MAKETKELEPTKNKTKKAVSSRKKTATKKTSVTKKTATEKKASSSAKKSTEKKSATVAKKTTTKKSTSIKKTAVAKKTASTSKKATSSKKTSTLKSSSSKKTSTLKSSSSKKTTTKKAVAPKTTTRKKSTTSKKDSVVDNKLNFQAEYYDLPFMYNKTVVKVLAQTPKMLFIYWEISEEDRNLFKKNYGKDFFNNTRPVLVVYNDTMNYSFEVEIDDFANSWYLHINDANCDYHIELGRRPKSHEAQHQNNSVYIPYYVYVTSSNEMTSPNNTILFNPNLKTVKFRNVKTGEIKEKDIMQFTFITNFGIFNIKDLYKFLFPNESFEFENIVLGNTSSGALSSSGMFSSQFK